MARMACMIFILDRTGQLFLVGNYTYSDRLPRTSGPLVTSITVDAEEIINRSTITFTTGPEGFAPPIALEK